MLSTTKPSDALRDTSLTCRKPQGATLTLTLCVTVGRQGFYCPIAYTGAGAAGAIAEAQQAVGTVGNPVTNVTVNGAELVVSFADGSSETPHLARGHGWDV